MTEVVFPVNRPTTQLNDTLPDILDGSDEPFEGDLTQSLMILFLPFVVVPLLIVSFRLIKFCLRIFNASLVGQGMD